MIFLACVFLFQVFQVPVLIFQPTMLSIVRLLLCSVVHLSSVTLCTVAKRYVVGTRLSVMVPLDRALVSCQ